jgi:hypothetical protein
MDHWMVNSAIGRAAILLLTIMLSEAASSRVIAQTLLDPNSGPKPSQPSGSAKPQPALRNKFCSSFGPGFVQLPGTDTCVKIGGFISTESAVNRTR